YTELVQTDVMVFDAQGRFVNGLKKEDFELRIDGAPKPIDFFEKVSAGSANEESQLAAARGGAGRTSNKSSDPKPLDRGRPIFFYVDDLHLDLAGLNSTRKLITHFIENEMGQNDEAAIASASGQIGFLQQLTDNKAVLRTALDRLQFRPYSVRDFDSPPMTEYQASLVDRYDRDVTDYFIDELLRQTPQLSRSAAESMVRGRASNMLQQGAFITTNTLAGLEGLVRSANKLSGRKLVFFISGGFYLDDRNSDASNKLRRITSAAARSSVVIYSIDARGLVASLTDASTPSQFDPGGRLLRSGSGDLVASQDGLNALAVDTGGKALFNSNSLTPALARAMKETSTYYLLAWKPAQENQHASKFRTIEVKVAGRPELKVQVRRGFFDREPEPIVNKDKKPKEQKASEKSPVALLKKVILATYPERDLPISLSLSYVNTPSKRIMLYVVLQVPKEFLSFATLNDKHSAFLTVGGVVFNDRGQSGASFNNQLTINAPALDAPRNENDPAYGYSIFIGPGIYQVRVGVRDEKSGRLGSAQGWIEIPNLSSGQFALSSVLLGDRASTINAAAGTENPSRPVQLNVVHNFSANGYLRFLVFVYNAALAPADSKPDVALQVQLVRDEQPVVTTPLKKVDVDIAPDAAGIPYAAEMSLSGLPAGRYLFQVTVVDRVAKRGASQQTHFEIE
ncbi:MAG: VWA domain-containing protein, partial [Acidobacteriota bacterium]|nr:VWA domain-containing protein [Acidobacteriota bacterium]